MEGFCCSGSSVSLLSLSSSNSGFLRGGEVANGELAFVENEEVNIDEILLPIFVLLDTGSDAADVVEEGEAVSVASAVSFGDVEEVSLVSVDLESFLSFCFFVLDFDLSEKFAVEFVMDSLLCSTEASTAGIFA